MTGQLQEGAAQGFASGGLERRIGAALLLLVVHRPDKALGHIPFGRGADDRFLLELGEVDLLLKFFDAAVQAFKHLTGFAHHIAELAIGEAGQVGHKDLAVVPQG